MRITTHIKSTAKRLNILSSVIGQMSDGIWENTRSMEKYWKSLDFGTDASGYIYLEAGQTYFYSGSGDDSAAIVIGDGVSSLHVNWKGTSTGGEGEFSVNQSGFYSFQFYAHNAEGIGNYNFTVKNTDGSDPIFYPNTAISN